MYCTLRIIHVMQYDILIVIRNLFNLTDRGTKMCHSSFEDNGDDERLQSSIKGFAAIDVGNLAFVNVEG